MYKKATFLLISIVLSVLMNLVVNAVEENLIKNPSFEEAASGKLSGWETTEWNEAIEHAQFSQQPNIGRKGGSAAVILSKAANDARLVQKIRVESGKKYKISCWTKTEDVGVNAKGANISVAGQLECSNDVKASSDRWVYIEMYARIGKGISSIDVTLGLGGYGSVNTGKACFDDVSVQEIGKIPPGAMIANISVPKPAAGTPVASSEKNSSMNPNTMIWIVFVGGLVLTTVAAYYIYKNEYKILRR